MIYFLVTDREHSENFSTIEEAKGVLESWKENYLEEGVSEKSFIEVREAESSCEPHMEESKLLQRFEIFKDEQQYRDFGTPKENGLDFEWWAEWQEIVVKKK